jgi:Helix-turn-helix domain
VQDVASIYGLATGDRGAERADADAWSPRLPQRHAAEPGRYLIPQPFAFVVHDGGGRTGEEYLTVAEVAAMLKLSPKRVRNMMSSGTFLPGEHFFRRPGIGTRFLRSRLDAWLRDGERVSAESIPMARSAGVQLGRRSVQVA